MELGEIEAAMLFQLIFCTFQLNQRTLKLKPLHVRSFLSTSCFHFGIAKPFQNLFLLQLAHLVSWPYTQTLAGQVWSVTSNFFLG